MARDAGGNTIRHDTRCNFNVHPKADISDFNLPHETKTKNLKKQKVKKTVMFRRIGKQSREHVESVLKKKKKATVGLFAENKE